MKKYFLFALSLLLSKLSFAADPILWHKLVLTGMGCPGGNVTKSFDPKDPNLLRIQLSQFELRKGQLRKACLIGLPLSLEDNQKLELTALKLNGTAEEVAGSSHELRIESFADNRPVVSKKEITTSGSFEHTAGPTILSKCGSKKIFRANTSLLAHGTKGEARVTEMVLQLKVLPCTP